MRPLSPPAGSSRGALESSANSQVQVGRTIWTSLLAALALTGPAANGAPASAATPVILANDNRVPAGALSHYELRIAPDARNGLRYPDGPNGVDLPVEAFGESGRALQIPGPLVRVPVGTEIVARIRKSKPGTLLSVHGMTDRPATGDRVFDVRYGQERTVRFRAGAVGTYFYWGTMTGNGIGNRTGRDSSSPAPLWWTILIPNGMRATTASSWSTSGTAF